MCTLNITLFFTHMLHEILAHVLLQKSEPNVLHVTQLKLLHHTTTILRPFFQATRVSRCQKRTSGQVQTWNVSECSVLALSTVVTATGKHWMLINHYTRFSSVMSGSQRTVCVVIQVLLEHWQSCTVVSSTFWWRDHGLQKWRPGRDWRTTDKLDQLNREPDQQW